MTFWWPRFWLRATKPPSRWQLRSQQAKEAMTYWEKRLRSMYVSMYLSIYRSIDLSIYRSIDLSIYRSIYLSMYLCIYVSMYLCIYVRMYVWMHVCIHACMHACMYVYIYVCMCIYIYIGYRFWGAVSLYSVLFKSTLNTTKRRRNCCSSRFPKSVSKISKISGSFFFASIIHVLFLLLVWYVGKECQWDQMSLSLVRGPFSTKGYRWAIAIAKAICFLESWNTLMIKKGKERRTWDKRENWKKRRKK